MKARSDTVPAWPFALACLCAFALVGAVRTDLPAPRGVTFQTARSHLWHLPARLMGAWLPVTWGSAEEGLQLGLSLHSGSGDVRGWLRNTNRSPWPYFHFDMGRQTYLNVEVRRGDEWVTLPRATGWMPGCVSGIGPQPKDLRLLLPSAQGGPDVPMFSASLHRCDWPPSVIGETNRVQFRVVGHVFLPAIPAPGRFSNSRRMTLRSAPQEIDPSHLIAITKARRQHPLQLPHPRATTTLLWPPVKRPWHREGDTLVPQLALGSFAPDRGQECPLHGCSAGCQSGGGAWLPPVAQDTHLHPESAFASFPPLSSMSLWVLISGYMS